MLGERDGVAAVAQAQLAAWEVIAEGWPDLVHDQTTVMRCPRCGQGVHLATDRNGQPFLFTHEQVLAQVVLHIRNHHSVLDPDVA